MIKIKEFREKKGLSQNDLAKELGVCQSTVGMWETQKNAPSTDKLPQLANILGCTIDELFGS